MTTAQPQKPTPVQVASGAMRLTNLVKGKQEDPRRILVSGVEGIGKSTFASHAPRAIFLGAEDGTAQLDIVRFPTPGTFVDVLDAVRELTESEHGFSTLVVDTVDWLEPLVWQHVCRRDGEATIESYGYGKGYQVALDEWRRFLLALEGVRRVKRMEIILLAHTATKTFKNPEGEDFDRYELALHTKAAGLLKQWCDAVLFAAFEQYAVKKEKTSKAKGFASGARLLHTERSAAFDAKNRYSLPAELPLSWDDFDAACKSQQVASPEELRAAIREAAAGLGDVMQKQALESIERFGNDTQKLAQLLNRCRSKSTTSTTQASTENTK